LCGEIAGWCRSFLFDAVDSEVGELCFGFEMLIVTWFGSGEYDGSCDVFNGSNIVIVASPRLVEIVPTPVAVR
jgi:hypothetical protein